MKITEKCPLGKINGIEINTARLCNKGNYTQLSQFSPSYVVMHYTGNKADSAINNATYYSRESGIGASAHLFVDSKEIYLSVPLNCKAWHVGNNTYVHPACRNSNAVGIEMCTSGDYKIADKTIDNAAYLCAELCKLIGITADKVDTYVLRHYDVTHKLCPRQMSGENNAEWKAFKDKVRAILGGGRTAPAKPAAYSITMPELKTGSQGAEVKTLQRLLRMRGWKGADGEKLYIDGDFGTNTECAVKKFQAKKGMSPASGTVDAWTWNKLLKS